MRPVMIFLLSLSLAACVEVETDDLKAFVLNAKSSSYPINDEVPALKKIDAIAFAGKEERNPFSEAKAEVAASTKSDLKTCPQPNFKRSKQALELYSTDNLEMRGTLFIDEQLWALVQVPSGELHKVKTGYYLGLNHGKVLNITKTQIQLLELASDSDGCWKERTTQITLQSQ